MNLPAHIIALINTAIQESLEFESAPAACIIQRPDGENEIYRDEYNHAAMNNARRVAGKDPYAVAYAGELYFVCNMPAED